ncbi:M20 family metallopeptidase [Merdimmobilis hominis]|jgi:amidohydrolase|uniref:M20 metallopeptidase family protein n=1 Tax=Merdimmobilis hominis TaxID=2897707 RepID=UPI0034BD1D55
MQITTLAKEVQPYVVEMRRYFHQHPELSNREDKTIQRIAQELTDMDIPYEEIPKGGILATIQGLDPGKGKTVLLRADIDALPVQEQPCNLSQPRVCQSQEDGVMHACGHDGHIAMLLGAAKILSSHREAIHGTVLLLFERGEENGGGIGYILAYMDRHGIRPDTVYGTHMSASLEPGKVGVITGGAASTAMGFDITLHGRGGHGSRPDLAVNPVDCFVAIYNGLQAARLTKVTPFAPLTLSIGLVEAGTAKNIIPSDLRFAGTVRLFDREKVGLPFREEMRRLVDSTAAAYGCTVTYNSFTQPGFPVDNDPVCAAFARQVIGAEIGEDAICQPEPWMASESFSQLQKMWSGVFVYLGVNNPEKGTGADHHNEYFDLDEDVLALGVTGAVVYALQFLDSGIDTLGSQWKGTLPELYDTRGVDGATVQSYYDGIQL